MKVKKETQYAVIPTKANPGDAGFDLYFQNIPDLTALYIRPHSTVKIDTGISIELPPCTYGLIADRSSMGSKGIKVMGGVIDNGYRGNIIVCLCNLTPNDITVSPGNKIAQLLILPLIDTTIEETNELETTERDSKGFGSSGA